MNRMTEKKGSRGKSGWPSDCCHTSMPKAAPGMPSVKTGATSWPSEGMNVGLGTDKRSGKNRARGSFKGGSVW